MDRKAPTISHLFFVDDGLNFSRANSIAVDYIIEILKKYQDSSGQMVNLEKSETSISQNMLDNDK